MNWKIKKGWLIVWGILLFLFITNPSIKSFKDYQGDTSYKGLRRENNFLLFSIYSDRRTKYIGIVLNFFDISGLYNNYSYGGTNMNNYTASFRL